MTRALFICSANKLRSPTAEHVFSQWPGIETDSAGLNNDADQSLSPEQIAWADVIFVMERDHLTKLRRNFTQHAAGKRVICLNICSRNLSSCWKCEWGHSCVPEACAHRCAPYLPSAPSWGATCAMFSMRSCAAASS